MILCAGLSPSWQLIYEFESLVPGEVNRALSAHQTASGKVVNAALAVHRLGGSCRVSTVLGGRTGGAIGELLAGEGVDVLAVSGSTPTRTCTTLVERAPHRVTELVENAGPISAQELSNYRDAFRGAAREADCVVFMGSLPEGAPASTYRELVDGIDVPVVADIRGPELLDLLRLRPAAVKPNRAELARTVNRPVETEDDLRHAMGRLHEMGASWVIISNGAEALRVCGEEGFHVFEPPRIREVNPIGSGDAMAGALGLALARGEPMLDAIPFAMGAAIENAARLLPVDIDRKRVEVRARQIRHALD